MTTSRWQTRHRTFGPKTGKPAHSMTDMRFRTVLDGMLSALSESFVRHDQALSMALAIGINRADAEEAIAMMRGRGASWDHVEEQISKLAIANAFMNNGPEDEMTL